MEVRTPFTKVKTNPAPMSDISKVQQHMANDCDIRTIVARARQTGQLNSPGMKQGRAFFADVADMPDMQEAFKIIRQAENMFAEIPAQIRKQFGNDPAAFVQWLQNPENKEKALEYGLLESVSSNKPGSGLESGNNSPAASTGQDNPK